MALAAVGHVADRPVPNGGGGGGGDHGSSIVSVPPGADPLLHRPAVGDRGYSREGLDT
jgi:hypothetical protein